MVPGAEVWTWKGMGLDLIVFLGGVTVLILVHHDTYLYLGLSFFFLSFFQFCLLSVYTILYSYFYAALSP